MVVEMKQLEYFIVCCDCESFSKAAQVLYTTQPNVSKVIYQMEKQLNTTLFVRNGRGISLTETGKKIYKYAVNIMENAEQISDLLNQDTKKVFSIASVPSNFLTNSFRIWYKEKREQYDQMRYLEGNVKQVIDYVKKCEADIGFVYLSQQHLDDFYKSLMSAELQFVELSKAVQVVAIGQKNQFYQEPAITKEMLSQMHFIHYQDKNLAFLKDELLMNQIIEDSGNQLDCVTNSENVILNLVEHTDIALLSVGWKCGLDEQQRNIRHIPLVDAEGQSSFGYICRKNSLPTEDMEVFIERIKG
jgi:DNA-binding transcriptional LysR family regulator